MKESNELIIKVKIINAQGEELAVSVGGYPLLENECEICAADSLLWQITAYKDRLPVFHKKPRGETMNCHWETKRPPQVH